VIIRPHAELHLIAALFYGAFASHILFIRR
jgi:hypothetical protein